MEKSDLLAHAAECERALQVATAADHRELLQQVRTLWLGLAHEQSMARHPEMQESIAALQRLHVEITLARATLH
jgi:hypothetical protein